MSVIGYLSHGIEGGIPTIPAGTSSLALNGGGRIFHSPSSLIFPACSPVLSDLLRDSLCTALQTEK